MAMAQSTVRGFFHSKWWIFPSFFLFEIHGYPTIPVCYVNVYLRGSSSIFQNGFSHAFPMGFPIKTSIFLWFSYGFSHGFLPHFPRPGELFGATSTGHQLHHVLPRGRLLSGQLRTWRSDKVKGLAPWLFVYIYIMYKIYNMIWYDMI